MNFRNFKPAAAVPGTASQLSTCKIGWLAGIHRAEVRSSFITTTVRYESQNKEQERGLNCSSHGTHTDVIIVRLDLSVE